MHDADLVMWNTCNFKFFLSADTSNPLASHSSTKKKNTYLIIFRPIIDPRAIKKSMNQSSIIQFNAAVSHSTILLVNRPLNQYVNPLIINRLIDWIIQSVAQTINESINQSGWLRGHWLSMLNVVLERAIAIVKGKGFIQCMKLFLRSLASMTRVAENEGVWLNYQPFSLMMQIP